MHTALIIFAKQPHAGRVKLRLSRAIGATETADLTHCFIMDTLDKIRTLAVARKDMGYMPEDARDYFRDLVAPHLDISTFAQQGDSLGDRLQHAFGHELSYGAEQIVAIDTDAPTLPQKFVEDAFEALKQHDVVLGPTVAGGFYLFGSRIPTSAIFHGIPWGTQDVFRQMVHNVINAGLSLKTLPPWYEVDSEHELQFLKAHLIALEHGKVANLPQATLEWFKKYKI